MDLLLRISGKSTKNILWGNPKVLIRKEHRMKSLLEKARKVLSHNQFLAVAIVVVICLGIYLVGCESTTISPLSGKSVTRSELKIENDTYVAKMGLAVEDLDKKDLFKQKFFEIGLALAQGNTINPVGAGVTLLSILGLGAVADNRKKDSIIKTLQNSQEANTGEKTTA